MENMKILMVDDEEYTMSDYREELEEAGHIITIANDLQEAVGFFESETVFDFVLIDLMLGSRKIPRFSFDGENVDLNEFYKKLKSQEHNEGQALGQWLWQSCREHKNFSNIKYCYFTNVPSFHQLHKDVKMQEFSFLDKKKKIDVSKVANFILAKPNILPINLKSKIEEICNLWNVIFLNVAQEKK